MGVPSLFRWLSFRYPSIVNYAYEEPAEESNGVQKYNIEGSNKNGFEYDNFYLDMNGIIHPCCHPENKIAPKSEEEMMIAISEYIERLLNIVRPRKLLYMAIDGVAPRAKMNQQRSRRFRSAKDQLESKEKLNNKRNALLNEGCHLPAEKPHFDNNCITPGTEFMHRLSIYLNDYISRKMNEDDAWKNLQVVLSDSNVPGEGEHKIMDFIRSQKEMPDYNPNTRHCICGADADLIMLALATHEPHFSILREEFVPNRPKPCALCEQYGHTADNCSGIVYDKDGHIINSEQPIIAEVKFLFIHIFVLREYLKRELMLEETRLPFNYDFERCLDDWIFLCFFVGNDFLPHLPSLEIRENAIDRLVGIYKGMLTKSEDYLTHNGFLNIESVELLLKKLGQHEDEIFRKRHNRKLMYLERNSENRPSRKAEFGHPRVNEQSNANNVNVSLTGNESITVGETNSSLTLCNVSTILPNTDSKNQPIADISVNSTSSHVSSFSNKEQADLLRKALLVQQSSILNESITENQNKTVDAPPSTISVESSIKRNSQKDISKMNSADLGDEIRLHEEGWRLRYYKAKFDIDQDPADLYNDFRKRLMMHYVSGLSWVLQYYYQGCPSWNWYYPYHYAPFASDCESISDASLIFPKNTKPFKPFQQLMAVFPPLSLDFININYRHLMTDPDSEIIDFYPTDFSTDLNGKQWAWQGVTLLPFIDEQRFLNAYNSVEANFSENEIIRNSVGSNLIYIGCKNLAYSHLLPSLPLDNSNIKNDFISLSPKFTCNLSGRVARSHHGFTSSKNDSETNFLCFVYELPAFDNEHIFQSKILNGCCEPDVVLKSSSNDNRRSYNPVLIPGNVGHRNFCVDRNFASNVFKRELGFTRTDTNSDPNYLAYDKRSQNLNKFDESQYRLNDYSRDNRHHQNMNSYRGRNYDNEARFNSHYGQDNFRNTGFTVTHNNERATDHYNSFQQNNSYNDISHTYAERRRDRYINQYNAPYKRLSSNRIPSSKRTDSSFNNVGVNGGIQDRGFTREAYNRQYTERPYDRKYFDSRSTGNLCDYSNSRSDHDNSYTNNFYGADTSNDNLMNHRSYASYNDDRFIDGSYDSRRYDNQSDRSYNSRYENRHDSRYENRHDSRYENRHDGRYEYRHDGRYENRHDGRYENRHDGRYENRHDGRYENRHDSRYENRHDGRSDNLDKERNVVSSSVHTGVRNNGKTSGVLDANKDPRKAGDKHI